MIQSSYPELAAAVRAASIIVIACALAACGGGGKAPTPEQAIATRTSATVDAIEPPLFDDEGHPRPSVPRAEPADPAVRAAWAPARWASERQAQQLEAAQGEHVLRVNVGCCGHAAVEEATAIAFGLQAAHNLPNSAPVLVRGADLRLAAVAAERMRAAGMSLVWLVTTP